MKALLTISVLSLALAGTTIGQKTQLCRGFFPKNNLRFPATALNNQGIDEATFNKVLDKLQTIYGPVAQAQGYTLQFNRLWSDDTVNSDTDVEGNSWVVNSYGGLARYPGMTADGYANVACHEIGHHLGGSPRFSDDYGMDWASVEGEADYFSTLQCMKEYFKADDNVTITKAMKIDPVAMTKCQHDFNDANSQAVCERESASGFLLATVLQQLDQDPAISFTTPDSSVVQSTFEDHPAAQCRLDTYFNGGLCAQDPTILLSATDYKVGSCVDTQADGSRPRCWFAP